MLKCKVCGTEFPAIKERHYIARDNGKTGLSSAFGSNDEEKIYPILGRIPPLLSEVKVGDECRFSDVF